MSTSHQGALHVVCHIDGVQLVSQEAVAQVHALLLATGVDGDDADVDHYDHAHDQVVLLQDHVGDQRNQIQGLLLRAVQLHHHHQQVGPREHRAVGTKQASTHACDRAAAVSDVCVFKTRFIRLLARHISYHSVMLLCVLMTEVSMSMGW